MKLTLKHKIKLDDIAATSLAFAPNGEYLVVSGYEDNRVFVYKINDNKPYLVKTLEMQWALCPPHTVVWENDKIYAVGDGGTTCYIWNSESFELEKKIDLSDDLREINSISVINDQVLIAGKVKLKKRGVNDIYVFDTHTWEVIYTFASGHFLNGTTWSGDKIWAGYIDYTSEPPITMIKKIDIKQNKIEDISLYDNKIKNFKISSLNGECYISANDVDQEIAILSKFESWTKTFDGINISSFTMNNNEEFFLDIFNGKSFEIDGYKRESDLQLLFSGKNNSSSIGIAYTKNILAIARSRYIFLLKDDRSEEHWRRDNIFLRMMKWLNML